MPKMEDAANPGEMRVPHRRLFLPSLVVSSFASGPITVLAALLLIDIGKTFGASVGVMGQVNTSYSVAAFIFALLMGVLSIRFKHKSLLLAGLHTLRRRVDGRERQMRFSRIDIQPQDRRRCPRSSPTA